MFFYIDFDAFFANAEKQLRPELRGRPVGVIPLESDHTSLIARCYLAKQAGIQRGTSGRCLQTRNLHRAVFPQVDGRRVPS